MRRFIRSTNDAITLYFGKHYAELHKQTTRVFDKSQAQESKVSILVGAEVEEWMRDE
jgi:hypothetical protein